MAGYYYLVSSLPMLELGRVPQVTSESFLESASRCLSPALAGRLATVALLPDGTPACSATHAMWISWETFARNTIASHRASLQDAEHRPVAHPEIDAFPMDQHVMEDILATQKENPIKRERMLDELRWHWLDQLSVRHEFDFDALVNYRLRLLLVEKWVGLDPQAGWTRLEEIVTGSKDVRQEEKHQ